MILQAIFECKQNHAYELCLHFHLQGLETFPLKQCGLVYHFCCQADTDTPCTLFLESQQVGFFNLHCATIPATRLGSWLCRQT